MGEVVLRRIQAGTESTRGTPVAATRKVYGTISPTRAQARKYSQEDRGIFVDKPRAGNAELIDAGFALNSDALFEDLPFYLSLFYNGGIAQAGSAALGYSWSTGPDETSDGLKTITLEVGDDTVAWQGAFGTVHQAEFTWALDDVLKLVLSGWVQDWVPATSAFLTTPFAGFTGSLTEHTVESVSGWQSRLFVDAAAGPVGTTWIQGRFKAANWAYNSQNMRKYFGDSNPGFLGLGRGRRQTHCSITFEAKDMAQYAQFYAGGTPGSPLLLEQLIRIALYGSSIGTGLGTTSGGITAGTITAIPVTALAAAVRGGQGISVGGVLFTVTPAGAIATATSIPVVSQVIPANIPTAQAVLPVKTMNFDFFGDWDTFAMGNVDTNTTFQFDLQAVYDATLAKESNIQVINGNSTI